MPPRSGVWTVLLCGLLAAAQVHTAHAASKSQWDESWYRASVDHVDARLHVFVHRDAMGREYVRQLDLQQLGLPTSTRPDLRYADEWYYRADVLPEHEVYVDPIIERVHFVRRKRTHIAPPPSADLLIDVVANGQRLPEPQLMHFRHGEIELSPSALAALNIDETKARALLRDNDRVPLHAVAGEHFALDYATLTLHISLLPDLLHSARIDFGKQPTQSLPQTAWSALLGYELTSGVDVEGEQWQSGLFDLSVGDGLRGCTSRQAWLSDKEWRRLDSRCVFDWPRRLFSVSLGDGITHPGLSGQAVRFGGLRFGTDYGLAPGIITQPGLALSGTARVPSTLEVWVDQMLALREPIPAGGFELSDIPLHSGAGEARVVVTDVFGRRELLSQGFYSDPSLLAAGRANWSVELGKLREGYLQADDHYGDPFALADLRYGLTNWLTLSPRLETTEDFTTAALTGVLRIGSFGVLTLGHARSRTESADIGHSNQAGFVRRGRRVSLALHHQTSDERFVQLGYSEAGSIPARSSRATVGLNLGWGASLSLGGFARLYHDHRRQRFHTATLGLRLGRLGRLMLTAFDPVEPLGERMFTLGLTIPLGRQSHAAASGFHRGEDRGQHFSLQRNLPTGPGFGYRLEQHRAKARTTGTAELLAQGEAQRLRLYAHQSDGATSGQAQLSGAVLAAGSGLHLLRTRPGSAAVVDVGAPGVRIYHDERLAAITDGDGTAVIPGLRPFEANRIRMEVEDLPLHAEVGETEARVTPGRRHAAFVALGVRTARQVSANLIRAGTGKPVPSGATISRSGAPEAYPVGFDGLVYFSTESNGRIAIEARWPNGRCRATIRLPVNGEPFFHAGETLCR